MASVEGIAGAGSASVPGSPGAMSPTGWRRFGAYIAITKPRIIELLLVTTVPTMILAADGWPHLTTVIAVLIGGTLAAAGANTFNSVYDRDIDAVMTRTHHRPMAAGVISVRAGVAWGVTLTILSVVVLAVGANLLSAGLALLAVAFYVFGYTMWLKRRTPQNIVWGGAAGCMPVLIAWAAVTGTLAWPPVVLFGVIFLWTPPHYWPLSLRFRDDYAAAGVPMLPVVADDRRVMREIVAYSWAMVAMSLVLIPIGRMGWVYIAAAVLLGAAFLFEAHRLQWRVRRVATGRALQPMRLFHWSITYLSLLFLSVAIDPFVG